MMRPLNIVVICLAALALSSALAPVRAETSVRVSGLENAPDRDEILARLEPRLAFIRSRPAGPSRADDAAFFLKRILTLDGYRDVDVDWSLPRDGSIQLTVKAGSRYTLGTVSVNTTFPVELPADTRLEDYFFQPFRDRAPGRDARYPYLRADVLSGAENTRNYLRSIGYWKASVETRSPSFSSRSSTVDISLTVSPGVRHTLARPTLSIEGVAVPPALDERLDQVAGKAATAELIRSVRKDVTDTFRGLGYQFLELSMSQTDLNGRTQLDFVITTGRRFTLDDVVVTGDRSTVSERITERFDDLRGQYYDREAADKSVRQLLATGAFRGIRLVEEARPDGSLDLVLRVSETKPDGFNIYAGVGSLEGAILGAGYYHRNVFGELLNFRAGVEYSGLGLLGEVSLSDPFFFHNDLSAEAKVYGVTRSYDGYRKFEVGAESSIDWQVNDYYQTGLTYSVAFAETDPDGLPLSELGPTRYLLNSLTLRQAYDRRNDPHNATRGYYLGLDTTIAFASGDGSVGFASNEMRAAYFHEYTPDRHLVFNARAGSILPVGDDDLPIDTRFFLGGANSVRSFTERDLGPVASNGIPRGGRSYSFASATYIHTISGPVRAVVFCDAGGLARDSSSLGLDDIKLAIGGGLRLDLPIGPVRLEYGHALAPDAGESRGAFHFAIGHTF